MLDKFYDLYIIQILYTHFLFLPPVNKNLFMARVRNLVLANMTTLAKRKKFNL